MKHVLFSLAIILGIVCQAVGQETEPFSLTHFGNFKKMMHMKKTDGVVNLKKAIDLPHVFAVGATAHGTGEITAIDSQYWIDYGTDGLGNTKGTIPEGEEAVLLVRAQVEEWKSSIVPDDMGTHELHVFILNQADSQGLDTAKPFPFLLEGSFSGLDWHVVNGLRQMPAGHDKGGIYNKLKEHRDQTDGTVVGFYSAVNQGVFTHPGESWHLHIVFEKENKAGHIDALSVRQGTRLKLPVIRP